MRSLLFRNFFQKNKILSDIFEGTQRGARCPQQREPQEEEYRTSRRRSGLSNHPERNQRDRNSHHALKIEPKEENPLAPPGPVDQQARRHRRQRRKKRQCRQYDAELKGRSLQPLGEKRERRADGDGLPSRAEDPSPRDDLQRSRRDDGESPRTGAARGRSADRRTIMLMVLEIEFAGVQRRG